MRGLERREKKEESHAILFQLKTYFCKGSGHIDPQGRECDSRCKGWSVHLLMAEDCPQRLWGRYRMLSSSYLPDAVNSDDF